MANALLAGAAGVATVFIAPKFEDGGLPPTGELLGVGITFAGLVAFALIVRYVTEEREDERN